VRTAPGSFAGFPPDVGPVVALATDASGSLVVVLRQSGDEGTLCSYAKDGPAYSPVGRMVRPVAEGAWLTPQVVRAGLGPYVGFCGGGEVQLLYGPMLQPVPADGRVLPGRLALLGPSAEGERPPFLVLGSGRIAYYSLEGALGWTPDLPPGSTLLVPPLAWRPRSRTELELAGLGTDGTAYWSLVQFTREEVRVSATSASSGGGYRAVAIVRPGLVAAVGPSRVDWLRAGGRSFAWSTTQLTLPGPVACFPCRPTGELIVVCGNGSAVRVTVPA
jgi:hypothetical protein